MELQFQFEWDDSKAASNVDEHGVTFDLASSVFNDPQLLTVADLDLDTQLTKIRIISSRKSYYQGSV